MIYIYKPRSDWHKRSDLTEGKTYECEWNGEIHLPVFTLD